MLRANFIEDVQKSADLISLDANALENRRGLSFFLKNFFSDQEKIIQRCTVNKFIELIIGILFLLFLSKIEWRNLIGIPDAVLVGKFQKKMKFN